MKVDYLAIKFTIFMTSSRTKQESFDSFGSPAPFFSSFAMYYGYMVRYFGYLIKKTMFFIRRLGNDNVKLDCVFY